MKITLNNGTVLQKPFTSILTTGYRAKSIELEAIDVRRMRELAKRSPEEFETAMLQFEHRLARPNVEEEADTKLQNNLLATLLQPLVNIANAYDANELDDEARKSGDWGQNKTPPEQIELYTGRGGRRLLTLADCLQARDCLAKIDKARGHGIVKVDEQMDQGHGEI